MLFTSQETQAMIALLNRTPMTSAEQLYAQGFFQRLVAFCQPKPGPESNSEVKEPGNTGKEKEHDT